MVRGKKATVATTANTKLVEDFEHQTDLFEIITKPLTDMSDEEIINAITELRKLRKVGMSRGATKTKLDIILSSLEPDKARKLLQMLESKEEKEKESVPTNPSA